MTVDTFYILHDLFDSETLAAVPPELAHLPPEARRPAEGIDPALFQAILREVAKPDNVWQGQSRPMVMSIKVTQRTGPLYLLFCFFFFFGPLNFMLLLDCFDTDNGSA